MLQLTQSLTHLTNNGRSLQNLGDDLVAMASRQEAKGNIDTTAGQLWVSNLCRRSQDQVRPLLRLPVPRNISRAARAVSVDHAESPPPIGFVI